MLESAGRWRNSLAVSTDCSLDGGGRYTNRVGLPPHPLQATYNVCLAAGMLHDSIEVRHAHAPVFLWNYSCGIIPAVLCRWQWCQAQQV